MNVTYPAARTPHMTSHLTTTEPPSSLHPLFMPLDSSGHQTAPGHRRAFALAVPSAWNALPPGASGQTPFFSSLPPSLPLKASSACLLQTATSLRPCVSSALGVLDCLHVPLFNLCSPPPSARTLSHRLSCLLTHLLRSDIPLIYLSVASLPCGLPPVSSPSTELCLPCSLAYDTFS